VPVPVLPTNTCNRRPYQWAQGMIEPSA